MKKILSLAVTLFFSSLVFGQYQFAKLVKEKFRVNPFGGTFPAFFKALSTDPDLLNKSVVKKTDTTLYLLKGEYQVFNPFSFKANKVEIIFSEDEVALEKRKDTSAFSYYNYQILVYCPDTEGYRKAVKKEYTAISRKIMKDLPEVERASLKGVQNVEDGEMSNFHNGTSVLYPATVSWQTLSVSKQLALTILLRLQITENVALPIGYGLRTRFEE